MIDSTPSIAHLYMTITAIDEKWGVVCTTTGHQNVPPHTPYPALTPPKAYNFSPLQGRTLSEYQLIYITEGEGTFRSASCPQTPVSAGMVIILFPGEWHSYSPDPKTGWREKWVGFRGQNIDRLVETEFISRQHPLLHIGQSAGLEECYNEIFFVAQKERSGFQTLISGIVMHMLGSILFKHHNIQYRSNPMVEIVDRAREIMRDNIEEHLSPEEIACNLHIGYTWFRRTFKQYVGISPAQYQLQLKYNKAREMLENFGFSVSEVAFRVGFENLSQFSTFFKSRAGISPKEYRNTFGFSVRKHDNDL